KARQRFPVERENVAIVSADDQEGRRVDLLERRVGQVRPPAARYHGADLVAERRGGNEGGGSARAGAEQSDLQPRRLRRIGYPGQGRDQAVGKQGDVEDIGAIRLLVRRQEVEQQGGDSAAIERL